MPRGESYRYVSLSLRAIIAMRDGQKNKANKSADQKGEQSYQADKKLCSSIIQSSQSPLVTHLVSNSAQIGLRSVKLHVH